MLNKLKIKKGDFVKIISGKDRNKTGEVIKVIPSMNKIIVSGVNIVKKHKKATKESEGGIHSMESPIHISNVAYFDNSIKATSKIGFKFESDKKYRYQKSINKLIK